MKNLSKMIIILCVFLILIIIILLMLLNGIKNDENTIEDGGAIEEKQTTQIAPESKINTYIYVNQIVENLFDYISLEEQYVNNAEAVLSILDKSYIKENNLTEKNVLEFLSKYKNINSYFSKEIYTQQVNHIQNREGDILYIKGIVRKNGIEDYIYICIKQDRINQAYSINFINQTDFEIIKNDNYSNSEINIDTEKNDYNQLYNKSTNDYQKCLVFFEDYINTINNNYSEGYKLLDEQYRNERFGNVENYTNSKQYDSKKLVLKQYSIEEREEYTQYLCVDQEGNYYIFRKTDFMNYSVILDTYTIDLPEFLEKYNAASGQEKIGMNIMKVLEAVNNKDYQYVYKKLNNTFKNNNFDNINKLTQYINTKFFDINNIEYKSFKQEGNAYVYNVDIIDSANKNNINNLNIIVTLKEGTDFEMAFGI